MLDSILSQLTLTAEKLLADPALWLCATLLAYALGMWVYKKSGYKTICTPLLVAIVLLVVTLELTGTDYKTYLNGGQHINFLLGPATVALALPLYNNRHIIKDNLFVIASGIIVATVTGIVSIFVCGKIFGASDQVLLSMIPKSVTTPIAMDISSAIGGIPALTAACVIFTGMFGATINHKLLETLKIKNNIAIGLSIGASSHGLGTSVCAGKNALQLAIGGASIGLTGIATSLLAPVLLPVLDSLF